MRSRAMDRTRREQFVRLLAVGLLAAMASGTGEAGAQEGATSSGAGTAKDNCAGLLVIQGKVVAIEGNVLTVKMPDSFPGGGLGMHAQFVRRGPEMRVDLSACRVLHPDGRQEDKQPLAVGDRVVVVLRETAAAGAQAENAVHTAAVVERVSTSDRVETH